MSIERFDYVRLDIKKPRRLDWTGPAGVQTAALGFILAEAEAGRPAVFSDGVRRDRLVMFVHVERESALVDALKAAGVTP